MWDSVSYQKLSERISDEKYRKGEEIERTSKVFTRDMVPAEKPLAVLDIGCGTGLNAARLSEHGHTVSGIDISDEAVKRFEARGFNGKKANIEEGFPYEDGAFDVVFASEVIEHVVDTEFFLKEANRVLRPGGMIVMSTPNSAFWVYRLFAAAGRTVTDVQHPGHLRFFTKGSLKRHAEATGFADVNVAARHMYLIVDGKYSFLEPILKAMGAGTEMRFRTGTKYWHLSGFSKNANGLWADTLILTAKKV